MKISGAGVVADGERRFWKTKDYWAIRRRVTNKVKEKYTAQFEKARLLRRLALWLTIRREVRERMKKAFPTGTLYVSETSAGREPIRSLQTTRRSSARTSV